MIYSIILLVLSFLLEGMFSNLVSIHHSFFLPLFTVVALVCIYPYFRKYDFDFFQICIVIGFCYDFIYTNTICIHAFLFWLLGYVISLLYHFFTIKIWNVVLITMITIIGYRFMSFTLLVIIGFIPIDFMKLWDSIISSFLSNIIFALLLYAILYALKKVNKVQLFH